MKEDKVGRAYSTHSTEDKCIEDLNGKIRKKEIFLNFNVPFFLVLLNERRYLIRT
jgi:hypothetical protein